MKSADFNIHNESFVNMFFKSKTAISPRLFPEIKWKSLKKVSFSTGIKKLVYSVKIINWKADYRNMSRPAQSISATDLIGKTTNVIKKSLGWFVSFKNEIDADDFIIMLLKRREIM